MKNCLPVLLAVGAALVTALSPAVHAQGAGSRPGGPVLGLGSGGLEVTPGSVAIKNINVSTPTTPEFQTLAGEGATKRSTQGKWLEVEVEFSMAAPARELSFRYYILIAGTLLVGDVTHVDIPISQSLFSVMYVAPRTLTTVLRGQPLSSASVQNISIQILRPGVAAPLAEKMLRPGPAFYQSMQQVSGFVLNKTQTPFAPLWWDRYEAVKSTTGGQ